MAALLSYLLSFIRNSSSPAFKHAFNLPFPPVMHQLLDDIYIKKFEEIFIIGDVHGCYDELGELLEKAGVQSDTCLKIFVGDLVNKGPKNHEVVEMVRKMASALCVRGNHDEVILREYFMSLKFPNKLEKYNIWIKDLPKEDIEYLSGLPYTISIPSLQVIVVHAGLVPGIPLECNNPTDMVTMRNLIVGDYFWEGGIRATKYDNEGEPWASLWPGTNHVYFGHDAKRMLQQYPYATGIDTGCVYGNSLSGIFISGPKKGTRVSVDSKKIYRKPEG